MSLVKGKNTKPEIIVRKFLFSNGFRFKLHEKKLPGKPDITLSKFKVVIFVHGCFWHGHSSCHSYLMPKTNQQFWYEKIKGNIDRDEINIEKLQNLGWKVIIVWECQLKRNQRTDILRKLVENIKYIKQ